MQANKDEKPRESLHQGKFLNSFMPKKTMPKKNAMFKQYRKMGRIACSASGFTVFLFLAWPLVLGYVYYGLDITLLDASMNCALGRQLVEGETLWLSPYMGNGSPLLLRPSVQAFYIFRWLQLLFSPELGASLSSVIHLSLAASGASALALSLKNRPRFAYFAGLFYALAGTEINLLLHTNIFVTGAAYLPWAWAFSRKALHPRGRALDLIFAWISLLAILLGGEPQTFLIASSIIFTEVVIKVLKKRRARKALIVAGIIPSAFLGGLLLWGGFIAESLALGRRFSGLASFESLYWSYDPALWLATVIPPLQSTTPQWFFWNDFLGTQSLGAWNPSPYLGFLFLGAALTGVFAPRTRVFGLTLGVSLILATGHVTGLGSMLLDIFPPLGFFRYPQKYMVPATLSAAVLASLAIERAARVRANRRQLLASLLPLLAASAGLIFFWSLRGENIIAQWSPPPWYEGAFPDHVPIDQEILSLIFQGSFFLLAACVLLIFARRARPWIGVLIALDLAVAAGPGMFVGESVIDIPSFFQSLVRVPDQDVPVLCSSSRGLMRMYKASGDREWRKVALSRVYLTTENQACDGVISAIPYSPVQTALNAKLERLFSRKKSLKAAIALGCTHVAVSEPITQGGTLIDLDVPESLRSFAQVGPQLYALHQSIPRIFIASAPVLEDNDNSVIRKIEASQSLGDILNVIDDPARHIETSRVLPAANSVKIDSLSWPQRDKATLKLSGTGGAIVGLKTVYQIGWTARQAEKDIPVLRVGGQHLAVLVDNVQAGPISLEYKSPFFTASVVAAIMGLIVQLFLAYIYRRGKNYRRLKRDGKS